MTVPPEHHAPSTDLEHDAVAIEQRQLKSIAYRLLGSLVEAEDVVQEAYARWYTLTPDEQGAVRSRLAWLTTVTSRICLDLLKSARVRRESYAGEWIPEPLPGQREWASTPPSNSVLDPAERVTLDESVNMAFLIVLESMTPAERVSFILHDVFRYPFGEIADIVGRSPAACRQLAVSARRRVRDTPTAPAPNANQGSIVRQFKQAWEAKDISALIGLLDPHAQAVADGGGLASAWAHPLLGGEPIAHMSVALMESCPAMVLHERTVNGQPGLVAELDGVPVTVYAFQVDRGRITRIWAVRNPEKLGAWRAES